MPTTSNFGWTTPADTDLVKDGALAIRTLGNGIDTSMAELKGGTTGQILSKTSNTDMDFTWINNDQGDITAVNVTSPITGGGTSGAVTVGIQDGTTAQKGAVQLENSTSSTSTTTAAVPASVKSAYDLANAAIPKSTVTTNGDLIYGTGSATVTRLGIGSTGQVLTVSGGVPTWAAAASGGAYTSIASGSLSGTTVTISSISGSYTDLYLIVDDLNLASANAISFRFNNDTTALYHQQLQFAGRIGGGLQSLSDSGTTVGPGYWYPASGDNNHSFFMRVNNYASSFTKTGMAGGYYKSDNGNWGIVTNFVGYQGTSAITRIDIITGATMNGGTYTLYGVK